MLLLRMFHVSLYTLSQSTFLETFIIHKRRLISTEHNEKKHTTIGEQDKSTRVFVQVQVEAAF